MSPPSRSLIVGLCGAALVAVLATQSACVAEIRTQCPVISEPRPATALPHDFAQLDGLLVHRALQMMHDVNQLHGSATTSFHIVFARDTLPLLCSRMAQAREMARAGQPAAAGRKYQALLVASQVMELAVAVHAVVEYADAVGEPSLVLVRTLETFGNQMTPILEAALTEDPGRIQSALRAQPEAFSAWAQYLERWSTHIRADAQRMEVAKRAWDISIGVIAAFETAGALAEAVATGGPPSAPALAAVGGGAELSGAAYVELAESVRRLIASGALDASVVAALSSAHMSAAGSGPATPGKGSLAGLGNIGTHSEPIDAEVALRSGTKWLGPGYREIAPGVYRSADGLRQFRMTGGDLASRHGISHVHFEALDASGNVVENLHLPVTR